jgi:phosphoribosylamine-glycine ligase
MPLVATRPTAALARSNQAMMHTVHITCGDVKDITTQKQWDAFIASQEKPLSPGAKDLLRKRGIVLR